MEKTTFEELYDLFFSTNIVRVTECIKMLWVEHRARMGDSRGLYRVMVGKTEEKRPLGRSRRRWEEMLRWIFRNWDVGRGLD